MERQGGKKRANPAVVIVSIIAALMLISLASFLVVFFLVIRPAEKAAIDAAKTGSTKPKKVQQQQQKKALRTTTTTTNTSTATKKDDSMSAGEKTFVDEFEKGVFQAIVDDISSSADLDRLVNGVSVKHPTSDIDTSSRKVSMIGEPSKLGTGGRVVAEGSGIDEWLDKLDSAGAMVRGPDGVLRPDTDTKKPHVSVSKQIRAALAARSSRNRMPSVLEGWDTGDLLSEGSGTKRRSREEMARLHRRLVVAAAQQKDAYPDGGDWPTIPFFEDLKKRIGQHA